jgi:ABC-2 type transport system permease protein
MAGVADRFFAAFGLDGARQRALLKLRLLLTRRQFEREPGKLAGFFLFLVIFGPIVLLLAAGSGFAYLTSPQPWPVQILGIVLSGLWLAWIVLPLFAFRTNEGLDLSRLLIYPLRTRDLVASALIGTAFDGPSYVTLPFFIAAVVGWHTEPHLFVVLLPALLIAYLSMMAGGQLVLTASMGLLRSRRFRDLSIVVISLLGSSCYFINRLVETWTQAMDAETLAQLEPLRLLRWLPPGACAQAVASAAHGVWLEALLWLGYAAAWLVLLLWMWWKLLLRMTTGASAWAPPAIEPKPGLRRQPPISERVVAAVGSWLPAPAQAMMVKELKLIWRVPQRRIGLLQSILAPFVLILAVFVGDLGALSHLPEWTALGLPAIMFFSAWGLGTNMLGMESRGLAMLLLTPSPRWQIFAGKGVAYAVMAMIPTAVYAVTLGVTVRSPLIFAGLVAGIGTALAVLGVNMIAAIYFTFPFDEENTTRQRSGGSCVTGMVQVVVIPLAMAVAAAPTMLPLAVVVWLNRSEFAALVALTGVLYAAGFFAWAASYAGRVLGLREAEVLAAANLER